VKFKEGSPASSLLELVLIVAVALGLALGIQAFLVKPYRIPSESMEPTLDVNQRVLVNRIGTHFGDPDVGDIVVFHPPDFAVNGGGQGPEGKCGAAQASDELCSRPGTKRASENFIKRVVAGPGDTITVRDGRVIRNGKPAKESFIRPCSSGEQCTFTKPFKVPPGHWFMMGDNRGESDDSRFWGPVPKKWIIGGAFATYWPPNRIGFL
jgi:signal peptidase I